ncbi:metallophosphoesterase [Fulvimarina endophytica]|uniref:Phosphoesterase n=1 Tax=Fulvimarina endophytica TaxID=2293836 RepID=A0A371X4N9_9HYPH|nr:metallophosphoesterase family protein [Fulvimarina endophytica]RFC64198.1 metallophosphoesterase [Fulvimarina endophytica]
MALVGIISDTHGLLRPEALAALAGVFHILHAGDIGAPDIVPRLAEIAPVTAIAGNIDTEDWAGAFPETVTLDLMGRRVHMLHDRKALALDPAADAVDLVIAGHSHKPGHERADGVLFLNPGSAGPRRFRLPVTLAVMDFSAPVLEPVFRDLV